MLKSEGTRLPRYVPVFGYRLTCEFAMPIYDIRFWWRAVMMHAGDSR